MNNQVTTIHDTNKYRLTRTIYAVGIDPAISPKEKIAELYASDSKVALAAQALEDFITVPDFRQNRWYLRFLSKVRRLMSMINRQANRYVKEQMAQDFIDELIHDGYLHCLKSMSVPSGTDYVKFARCYAKDHDMPLAAAMLFGPSSGTRLALQNFLAAEVSHGQHRPVIARDMIQTTRQKWFDADKAFNWPVIMNEKGREDDLEIADEYGRMPDDGNVSRRLWGRHKSFRDYIGTNRLSGDIPFQLIEDAVDIILRGPSVSPQMTARYDKIVESANHAGIDPFYAVHRQMFNRGDELKPYWDRARRMLYEHSLKLWEKQNKQWLLEGLRIPAAGVTFRKAKAIKRPKKKIPGTVYLNGTRYYWAVARKMKAAPLIDPATAPKFPGTILKDKGRYYWWIPRFLKRQRLAAKGEKFSTADKTKAQKIALAKWKQIQKDQPDFAGNIQKHTRSKGLAAKDKKTALKIALKMWRDIQKNDPKLADRISTSKRAKPIDHWHAQIKAKDKMRFIGSFKTRQKAEDAYRREFEKVHGYPVGYNIQSIPKMDKVWPTWQEQKERLESMVVKPTMPVIGPSDKAKPLISVIDRMQKVDWLARNCMVVLDDNAPRAMFDIAVQSRGQVWCAEIKEQGKNLSIYGSTAIDKDSKRIRVTLFRPAFENCAVLAEEVYHLVYRIIGNTKPAMAKQIQNWYGKKIRVGMDPTLSEDEAFAQAMAYEDVADLVSDLPRSVVRQSKKLFSPSCRVPARVFKNMAVVV